MSLTPFEPACLGGDRAPIERLLDANLDRSREGLRVLEDWVRFGLDRPDLVARIKDLRQRLGRLHKEIYKRARHTASDPGAGLTHSAQVERQSVNQVVAANAGRVQEALRVLEEFGRLVDPCLAVEAATIRYLLYDLEVEILYACRSGDDRRRLLQNCLLYLITSPQPDLAQIVKAALEAGVRLVQYRSKPVLPKQGDEDGESCEAIDDQGRLEEARMLRQLCHRHGALLIINDRIDLALAVDADGVHLGQGDLPPAIARRLLGPDRLIGRSTHCIEQLHQAVTDGCDYVGVGPIHATPTKPGRQPVGLAYVADAAQHCPIPFFAIGGVNISSLPAVLAVGANRVAVVRAITQAADPAEAVSKLLALLEPGAQRPSETGGPLP